MSRRNTWILVSVLVLIGLSIASLPLLKRIEHYEEVVDQGPSPDVRANPYLAAQTYLRGQHVPVSVAETLNSLPDTGQQAQTLMLLDTRENMTPGEVRRLLAWARAGGRLLFVAEQLWDEEKGRSGDLLLDQLQIRQFLTRDVREQDRRRERELIKPVIPLSAPEVQTPKTPWPELTRLYVENESDPAYMSFDPAFHLDDPQDHARSWANSADATHLLQLIYGKGLITIVTDADLWKTRAIGKYDNAWLLWYLSQDSEVTMLLRTEHDDLFGLLWKFFPQALLALGLCLVATLWHAGMRHGPMLPLAPRARRQLSEHLRASADFMLRRRGQHALLRALQQDILRRARQLHPGFETLPVTEQWQTLARMTRQPTSSVGQALRPRPEERLSNSDFTRQVAYLQTLRNAL
ncbi:DUF4350 domain-containing protein [Pseudomonas sp. NFR16]|uniref:DUF4350 domain-containing protein n=1 Tax=Pseudomonas sp. NFR16 TaxID=1566248 RepID=UPI0008B23255|nr:DUF4350 domain-containing protein [Pseudomonas sp. NFR16]SEJ12824.1 protein of unknown function [Pseudomonas sp. NFR16]